jgi:putative DNA methylase
MRWPRWRHRWRRHLAPPSRRSPSRQPGRWLWRRSPDGRIAPSPWDAELAGTPLRALLYALYELSKDVDIDDVLIHLMDNCRDYFPNKSLLAKIADYLAETRESLKGTKTFKPEVEASSARILAEAIRNQRL